MLPLQLRRSGTVPVSDRGLPSHPEGLYEESLSTEQVDPAQFGLGKGLPARADESAAFSDLGWTDDDTTAHGAPQQSSTAPRDESWEDDSTTVVADDKTG